MNKITFRSWWKATKAHSTSQLGAIETNLIINFFVAWGAVLGAFQVKFNNGLAGVSFMLFAFGAINGYNVYLLYKQYKAMKKQIAAMEYINKHQTKLEVKA